MNNKNIQSENVREERRNFLKKMVMAGVVYSSPILLPLNAAQADECSRPSKRRRRYSHRKHSSCSSYPSHRRHRSYVSRPRINVELPTLPVPSKITIDLP